MCSAIQFSTLQCSVKLCCKVQYSATLDNILQCSEYCELLSSDLSAEVQSIVRSVHYTAQYLTILPVEQYSEVGQYCSIVKSGSRPAAHWSVSAAQLTALHILATTQHIHLLPATAPHCTALHCTARHCTGLHCTLLNRPTLPSTAKHYTLLNRTTLHNYGPHCTALHRIAQHCTTLHYTAL